MQKNFPHSHVTGRSCFLLQTLHLLLVSIFKKYYHLNDGNNIKKHSFFMATSKVRFSAFGDWGMYDATSRRTLERLSENRRILDFCVLLGDNFYPDGVESTTDNKWGLLAQFPQDLPLYAVMGNHDYHGDAYAQVRYSYASSLSMWNMPFFFYDRVFCIGNESLHILFVDTCFMAPSYTDRLLQFCGVGPDRRRVLEQAVQDHHDAQVRWVKETLTRSTSRWKIVCGHYPMVSNGPHPTCPNLYRQLMPVLERHGVDAYLSGHDHNAQVIEHRTVCCIVSGATTNQVVSPQRWLPGTMFVSTDPGQFIFEADEHTLEISYLKNEGGCFFIHQIIK